MSADAEYPADYGVQRLDAEAEEKLVDRLYYQQVKLAAQREEERQQALAMSRGKTSTKRLDRTEEEHLVKRIYDQQLQRFAMAKTEREQKMDAETRKNDKTMSSEEIEDQVRRMYNEELEKSRRRRAELEARYIPTKEEKKVPKKELQETVERLSHVDWEKRDEELFKKHVYPYDPKTVKISQSEVEAMANRLSTTKGSA